MRQIKFRAWDKKNNKMLDWEKEKIDGSMSIGRLFLYPNDYELMQFTNSKDKDGKEMYEGNIVKGVYIYSNDSGLIAETGIFIAVKTLCGYDIRKKTLVWEDKEINNHIIDREYNEPKIIGNIYENPELIKN